MRQIIKTINKTGYPANGLNYDPKTIMPGIAHIGVGNFHRAHQAYYTHQFLNLSDSKEWGIVGIGITLSGQQMARQFRKQKNLYTLTTYKSDGSSQVTVIGSIVGYIAAVSHTEKAIEQLASPSIKIVTLTITEGGYNLDRRGIFDLNNAQVQQDMMNPESPQTAFGYIVEALRRRKERGIGPFTILSCDNLIRNGNSARKAFVSFAMARSPELGRWIADHVTFPNSVVDRITPVTEEEDSLRLNIENGIDDTIPVYAEDFTQWIIEDDFCAGRPEWEMVGVKFTHEVEAYENVKLRLLNASHSMLAYPAFLAGYRKVDEALGNKTFRTYLDDFMHEDASPFIAVPTEIDLKNYKKQLLVRFANTAVSDQLERLCFHGGAKIPAFVMPTLLDLYENNMDIRRLAFLIASYGHYLKYEYDDEGNLYEIDAPALTHHDWQLVKEEDINQFLNISPLSKFDLLDKPRFVKKYAVYRQYILKDGALKTLQQINRRLI